MIAAAHDQSDPPADSHAGNRAAVGKRESDLHRFRGNEGDAVLHGAIRYAGLPGKNGAVCHKGAQAKRRKLRADELLILGQMNDGLQPGGGKTAVKQRRLHAGGQEVKEDALQLGGVDGPAVCRKTHGEAHQELAVRRTEGDGGTLQNLLSAAAYRDQAAFSGALCLEAVFFDLLIKRPVQIILQGDSAVLFLIVCGRKGRLRPVDLDAETGRRGEGVALYMVDSQDEASEGIGPLQILVGRIALMIHRAQHTS